MRESRAHVGTSASSTTSSLDQRAVGSRIASRRNASRRRKWNVVSSSTTIGSVSGRPSTRTHVDELADERADRQLGERARPNARPHATTSTSPSTSRASVCSRTSTPRSAARRTSSRATSRAGSRRRPRGRSPAPSTSSVRRPRDLGGVDVLDRDAEPALQLGALAQPREPVLGRREEQVADLEEERRAELAEERDRRLREPHLRRGRELLPHAAHRLAGRAGRDLGDVAEHDVVRAEEREVVRDRGAHGARARYDNSPSSHASSSCRSSGVSPRSGARTSSVIGTPRRAAIRFSAACRGKRSIASRISARRGSTRDDLLRQRARERRDRPDRAVLETLRDQRLRPDEARRAPRAGTARTRPTACRTPSCPTRFGAPLAQPLDHRRRHRIAARARELVDVEGRRRRTRRPRRRSARAAPLVELEVRRRDHGDAVHAGRSAACAASSTRRHASTARRSATNTRKRAADEELDRALAARRPRAVRPRPSSPGRARRRRRPREKLRVRREGVLVERRAAVSKRRQRSGVALAIRPHLKLRADGRRYGSSRTDPRPARHDREARTAQRVRRSVDRGAARSVLATSVLSASSPITTITSMTPITCSMALNSRP